MPSRSSDIDPLARTIGDAARRARKRLRLTLEEAARRVGVSTVCYARIERGRQAPGVATLASLARALETSASNLLGLSDEASWDSAARSLGISQQRRGRAGRTERELADVRRVEKRLRDASPGAVRVVLKLLTELERAGIGEPT